MTEQLIISARSVADVVEAVGRARREERRITVVGGGHGPWSHIPDEGMRIELSAIDDIEVDGTTVRVGGGATWGAVAARLAEEGLAISSGDTASVGVGGLTLGGGIGWMTRLWGLAVDQLVGAQVVTADGTVVEASATEHPDLFWALRGGGGNFGIVTRFDFAAHRLPAIVHGEYSGGDPATLLRRMRDVLRDAPHELTVTYMDVPPMDPSAPAGARLTAVWAGADESAMHEVLAPIGDTDGVQGTVTTPAYRDILMEPPQPEDPDQQPPGFIGGNGLYAELDDDLIDRLVAFRAAHPVSVVFLRSLGGAYGEVPQESTPFPARHATWFVMAGGFDIPGLVDDEARAAIEQDWSLIGQGRLAEYGNFAATERPEAVPGMFGDEAYARLRAVKAQWDPQNVFRRNHNIV
ncbi:MULTISPECIES: FAD-binding oxidoreductase [unclassified Microbacterium]|uniref:FAD-binding oxidoreductase n=1 Tax=unclassified Microbacterium TaxID=2609290 RepID=UPI0012FA2978|nr:FAD-binding oxidoreductase [Microbacterium sp. MAH-37]MVQ41113.1 FAD-binding protein [Microbacterium sp. MAH-37]